MKKILYTLLLFVTSLIASNVAGTHGPYQHFHISTDGGKLFTRLAGCAWVVVYDSEFLHAIHYKDECVGIEDRIIYTSYEKDGRTIKFYNGVGRLVAFVTETEDGVVLVTLFFNNGLFVYGLP